MTVSWPVVLSEGPVRWRPLRRRDASTWRAVRAANASWLRPWEATSPDASGPAPTFPQMVRGFSREARAGRMLPFVVELDDGFRMRFDINDWQRLNLDVGRRIPVRLPGKADLWLFITNVTELPPIVWVMMAKRVRIVG